MLRLRKAATFLAAVSIFGACEFTYTTSSTPPAAEAEAPQASRPSEFVPTAAPVEKPAVEQPAGNATPAAPAPPTKPASNMVIRDLDGLKYNDAFVPAKVQGAFAQAPASMLRMTTEPIRAVWYFPYTDRLKSVQKMHKSDKSRDGIAVRWDICDNRSRICFDFIEALSYNAAELPKGTPGLMWSHTRDLKKMLFVTADGGVYRVDADTQLAPYDGGAPPEPAYHAWTDERGLRRYIKAGATDASFDERIKAAAKAAKQCANPIDAQLQRASDALWRKNLNHHTKEARQERLDDNFYASVNRKCGKHITGALDAMVDALADLVKQRRAAYDANVTAIKTATAPNG